MSDAAILSRRQTRAGSALRRLLALLLGTLALISDPAFAEESDSQWPLVREIAFRGNDVTQPHVMEREIGVRVGDPADPAAIERSRQAILDLGLFRAVDAIQEPLADGVRLVFVVTEKWYLLPYPRLSANSDGQDAIGAELRWNNVGGLNHSLRMLVSSADRRDEGRGRQLGYLASYRAPFIFDTPYTLGLSGSHATTPVDLEAGASYDEIIDEAQMLVSRKFGAAGAASQGWNAGAGLLWRSQNTDGAGVGVPAPWGDTYAVVTQLGYRDEHDRVYSEVGTLFGARYEYAAGNVLSDYGYSRLTGHFKYARPLGATPHQTVEFSGELGTANGGRSETPPYSLGGTQGLRGYARGSFEGNAYYLVSASYLRPLGWDWLRLVATVEAGNVYDEADQVDAQVRWSFGLGLRVRVPRLVGVEIEAGIALPLSNDSARFYGYRSGL
ncbi:MAG: BamA/TamA family outer membrane protein [Sinimarinibacterium sp.]|jgi:outer membrane protein assembly factor BamA